LRNPLIQLHEKNYRPCGSVAAHSEDTVIPACAALIVAECDTQRDGGTNASTITKMRHTHYNAVARKNLVACFLLGYSVYKTC